jgi:amino acid transporter
MGRTIGLSTPLHGVPRLSLRALLRSWTQAATLVAPLPRAAPAWDVFVYNVYFTSFALALVYLYVTALQVAPASSLVPGVVLAGVLSASVVSTYALLAALMPRLGGDYVYVGEVLGPSLGFLASWNWVVWLSFWVGFGGYTFSAVGLRGWAIALALATGRADLLALAKALGRPDVAFLVGTGVVTGFGVLVSLGMRTFFRVQRWSFVLAAVSVGLTALALATEDANTFARRLDGAALSLLGVPGVYAAVAKGSGAQAASGSALNVVPAAFLVLPWTIGSAFIGPEVRDVRRTQPLGMLVALLAVTATAAVLGHLLVRAVGPSFLVGLASGAGERVGIPLRPYLHEVAFLSLGGSWPLAVAAIGYLCLGWMYVGQNVINSARVLMAWARDGLVPPRWAEVHPRLHVPCRATWAVVAAGEVFLALVCFAPSVHLLSSILALSLSAGLACLSAVVLPLRRPELLRGVAARTVAGVPLLALVGGVGLVVLSYVDLRYLADGRYGANNLESLHAVAVVLAAGPAYRRWASGRWSRSPSVQVRRRWP